MILSVKAKHRIDSNKPISGYIQYLWFLLKIGSQNICKYYYFNFSPLSQLGHKIHKYECYAKDRATLSICSWEYFLKA